MPENLEAARAQMVSQQVRTWSVLEPAVLRVMSEVPRERFVPAACRGLAFADTAIPLPEGQHMLTPQIEGRILQTLEIGADDAVLEVGTGSGFMAACLARLGGRVLSLEIRPALAESARDVLRATGARGVEVRTEDVFSFRPTEPFNCIVLTGSLPVADARFEEWLAPGGRLFLVTGARAPMAAWLVRRGTVGSFSRQSLFETVFDPLDNAPQPERFIF